MQPQELNEWTRHFAMHRFRARGIPFDIKELQGPFAFALTTATKKETYAIAPQLQSWKIPADPEGQFFVVTAHTQSNVDALINLWQTFVTHERLVVIFANPHSAKDKYWIIHPSLHNSIADPATLKTGLASMATMVDFCP